jgi:hypothetical protein
MTRCCAALRSCRTSSAWYFTSNMSKTTAMRLRTPPPSLPLASKLMSHPTIGEAARALKRARPDKGQESGTVRIFFFGVPRQ